MISAYVGLPGAGKTYSVVKNTILPALQQGRRVVTNVPLNRDAVRKLTPKGEIVELPIEQVATQPETIDDYCTAGSVVVLDEAWRLWPAGVKSHQVPESFRSLLAEHRHRVDSQGRAMSIVIVTQDLQQISAWARSLIETTFVHTQLSHVGANRKYRVASYRGGVDTIGAPQSRMIRESYGTYRKNVYELYQSHTMRESAGSGADESPVDKRANVWRRPAVWVGLLFVVAAPAWGITTLVSLFSLDVQPDGIASVASHAEPVVAPQAPGRAARELREDPERSAAASAALAARRVPDYRVAGVVRHARLEREGYAMIQAGDRFVSVPISSCWFAGDGLTRCAFDGFTVSELGAE